MSSSTMHFNRSGSFITIEPGIERSFLICEFRICKTDINAELLTKYLKEVAEALHLSAHEQHNPITILPIESTADTQHTLDASWSGKNGKIHAYYWPKQRLLTMEAHTRNSEIPTNNITQITKNHFGLIESTQLSLAAENAKQENSKIEVRDDVKLGRGVFAKEDIAKGEFIGGLYGKFHKAKDCMALPEEYRDHVMQCAAHLWRGNKSAQEAVQYLNHSCDPNCGVHGLFDFVAMRNIKAGEQITTDYAMQDDSNWVVPGGKCLCGAANCRGTILPYRDLPKEDKKKYQSYTSHWILHKYSICSCAKK